MNEQYFRLQSLQMKQYCDADPVCQCRLQLAHIPFQFLFIGIGSLKSAMVGLYKLQNSADAICQAFLFSWQPGC